MKLLFILLFVPILASAHVPVFLDTDPNELGPFQLNRPFQKSIAIYTQFEKEDDVDVYSFSLNEEDLKEGHVEILIGTLVPSCRPLKDLLISWRLAGPKQLSLTVTNESQGKIWYEPFTSHYYFYQKRERIKLDAPGEYKIYVWSSSKMKGDYVFEFGDKEIWSLNDILYTLWVYPKLLLEGEIITKDCETSPE